MASMTTPIPDAVLRPRSVQDHIDELPIWADGTKLPSVPMTSMQWLIWSLVPTYNMLLIALSDDGDEFTGLVWPEDWNWDSFRVVVTQNYWYLQHFWVQFGNSVIIGVASMVLTALVARHDRIVGESDNGAPPRKARPHLRLKPFIEHMVQENI